MTEISLLASLDSTLYIKQLLFTVDICKLIHTLIALNCHCTTLSPVILYSWDSSPDNPDAYFLQG